MTVWKVVKMCFVGCREDNTQVIQNSATQNAVDEWVLVHELCFISPRRGKYRY